MTMYCFFFKDYDYDGGDLRRTCQNGAWTGDPLRCQKIGLNYINIPPKIIVFISVKKK